MWNYKKTKPVPLSPISKMTRSQTDPVIGSLLLYSTLETESLFSQCARVRQTSLTRSQCHKKANFPTSMWTGSWRMIAPFRDQKNQPRERSLLFSLIALQKRSYLHNTYSSALFAVFRWNSLLFLNYRKLKHLFALFNLTMILSIFRTASKNKQNFCK